MKLSPPESVQPQSWPPPSPSPGPPKTSSYSSHCLRPKPVFQEQKHIGTIKRTWNEPQRSISITSSSTCSVTFLKEQICHQDKLKQKPRLLVSSAVCGEDGPGSDLGRVPSWPLTPQTPVGLPASLNTKLLSPPAVVHIHACFCPPALCNLSSIIHIAGKKLRGYGAGFVLSRVSLGHGRRKGRKMVLTPPRIWNLKSPASHHLSAHMAHAAVRTDLAEYLSFGCVFIIS